MPPTDTLIDKMERLIQDYRRDLPPVVFDAAMLSAFASGVFNIDSLRQKVDDALWYQIRATWTSRYDMSIYSSSYYYGEPPVSIRAVRWIDGSRT